MVSISAGYTSVADAVLSKAGALLLPPPPQALRVAAAKRAASTTRAGWGVLVISSGCI
jgi:hypothetical protein